MYIFCCFLYKRTYLCIDIQKIYTHDKLETFRIAFKH